MTDHALPADRLATGKPIVCIEQPSFVQELLITLVVVQVIAIVTLAGHYLTAVEEATAMRAQAQFWMESALAPDTAPTIRVDATGDGIRCSSFKVRREWERAVSAKCIELGSLLIQARTTE